MGNNPKPNDDQDDREGGGSGSQQKPGQKPGENKPQPGQGGDR